MELERTQTSERLRCEGKHFNISHTNIITTAILGVSLPLWRASGLLLKASKAVKKTLMHEEAKLTENRQCGNTLAQSSRTCIRAYGRHTHTTTHTSCSWCATGHKRQRWSLVVYWLTQTNNFHCKLHRTSGSVAHQWECKLLNGKCPWGCTW